MSAPPTPAGLNPVAKTYLECVASLADRYETTQARLTRIQRMAKIAETHPNTPPGFLDEWDIGRFSADMDKLYGDYPSSLALLRRARVFDLSPEVYRSVARRVNSGELVGVPDLSTLPFDVCWFGSGTEDVLALMGAGPTAEKVEGAPHPLVLTRCGLILYPWKRDDGWMIANERALDDDGWDPETIVMAWIGALLATVAMTHAVKSNPMSLAVRRLLDRAGKHRPAPPELYTVHMNGRQAGHAVGTAIAPHAGPGYRFEVAGHPRLLVRRGRWPDEDRCAAWRARGYETFRGGQVPPEWLVALDLRGVARPLDTEWVALRIVQVKDHEKGPDGPVIRAVRVS